MGASLATAVAIYALGAGIGKLFGAFNSARARSWGRGLETGSTLMAGVIALIVGFNSENHGLEIDWRYLVACAVLLPLFALMWEAMEKVGKLQPPA